ncbi:RibD family protein [Tabrizicola sp. M-4]|uniref:RibD family protein n=1 Tax=Tabrizicola sp. M-4 TaxID=3055847 RepID=UPI003DA87398
MHSVEVTPRVWDRLLSIRAGRGCACCGRWSAGERAALDLYAPLARRDLGRQVVAQIGQSLDGRVATHAGDARDVSGPDGLAHLHRLRALVDGVLIGVRTALHDRPRLTVRLCRGDSPARIVVDPQGRMPDDLPLLHADGVRRIVVQGCNRPREKGVEVVTLPMRDGRLDPCAILDALQGLGVQSLLVEGGGITIARFLEAGLLNRLQVAVSPLLIGGGPQGITLQNPVAELAHALRPETRNYALGPEVVFDCALDASAAQAWVPVHAAAVAPRAVTLL